MAASIVALSADLLTETAALERLVGPLDDAGWETESAAPGWTIRDQIVHLARTDESARLSVTDPERFADMKAAMLQDRDAWIARMRQADEMRAGSEALALLDEQRGMLLAAVRDLDPGLRVPWFGPDMTLASSLTARIMETWAHGQDCFDALGVEHEATATLYHVAFIGARALPNSYRTHGRPVPDTQVRVELAAPDGSMWVFGPDEAADVVRGPAVDFCLVVTQRRHVVDTALTAEGDVAAEWLTIAQAFAGPAGEGRTPGQFSRMSSAKSVEEG